MSVEDALDNWKRWARQGLGSSPSVLGQLYKSSSYEKDSQGEIVSVQQPRPPIIDILDAERTEKAILKLPREPYNAPRLIVYHYIYPHRNIRKECRRIGVKVYRYEECLSETLSKLEDVLETI